MINRSKSLAVTLMVSVSFLPILPARALEIDELKATIQTMQQSMEQMQTRITELEQENHKQKKQAAASRAAPPPAAAVVAPAPDSTSLGENGTQTVTIAPTTVTIQGRASQIKDRPAMDDQQEAAPRPNDLTLDPEYRGFVPIPNTPVLIKFNAKPRVDFTDDPQNTGNPDRVIKEAYSPELGGTATGVVNFLNFTFSALLGPVFGARLMEMPEGDTSLALAHYQAGFQPLLYGIVLALILTVFLRETGPASRKT
jgi:hypothetical protein